MPAVTDNVSSSLNLYDVTNASGAVAIISDHFIITHFNRQFAGFLGFSGNEIKNKKLTDFVVAGEKDKTERFIENALTGYPENNYVAFTVNGEYIVGNVSLVPLFDGGLVNGVYCFIKDVSSKVISNRDVFDREQRLKAIFDNEPECVKIVSVDGFLEDINPAGIKMLEAKKENLIGKPILPAVHEEDRPLYQALHERTCNGKGGSLEFRMQGLNGTKRWMHTTTAPLRNKNGDIYAVLSVTRDITQQKETELKIQLSEKRFKNLVSNGSDIITILNEEKTFQYLSDNITTTLGYTTEELINKNAFNFIHPEDIAKVMKELQKVVNKDDTAKGIAHRFLSKTGAWLWLESKGTNHLEDPSIKGIVINARDITDRIKLQDKLNQEMADKQRQITAAVIETQEKERTQLGLELHDNVNQVLTTIKLYNEMLLDGMENHADILNRSVKHLQECINEIRSISKRLSAPTLGKISLDESINELIHSINLTDRLSINYFSSGITNCVISQDLHLAIYRIIQEQLNNVLKHAKAQTVNIRLIKGNRNLSLTIVDDGTGFDRKTKREGIGITNMMSRAEHMGGSFKIETAPGEGCSVLVNFKTP